MSKLSLELLEARSNPAVVTVADIRFAYVPEWNPMPGVADDKVGVIAFDADPADPLNPICDLFFALDGGAPRLRAINTETGAVVFDRFLFDEGLRGGLTSAATIGNHVYFAVGKGGAAAIADVNMTTFDVSYFFADGFPDDWRGGVKVYAADVDAGNGTPTPRGGEELLVLPAGQEGGPVVYVMDVATKTERFAVRIGPSNFRGEMEAVPAGLGAQLSHGLMGGLWQEVGHPENTYGVAWTGEFAAHDYIDDGTYFGFADPIEVA